MASMAVVTSVFAFEGAEQTLVDTIFKAKWGLNEEQSEQVIEKMRLANENPNYENLLNRLCAEAMNLKPAPLDGILWDDALDAPVAEPLHHILAENAHVRILDLTMEPGEVENYHTHKYAGIIMDIIPSDFTMQLQNKAEEIIFLPATGDPMFVHTEGLKPYSMTNVGANTYIGLHFEIKE